MNKPLSYSFDSYKQRYGIAPDVSFHKAKETFRTYCLQKIAEASGGTPLSSLFKPLSFDGQTMDCWSELEVELLSSPYISIDRLEQLSYLVHLDKKDLETFQEIKKLCLSKQYDKIKEKIRYVRAPFFAEIFSHISDRSIRFDIVKLLNSRKSFQPYLDSIRTRHPFRRQEEKIAKIEQDLQSLFEPSLLKNYLIQRGVLDRKGKFLHASTFSESWRNVLSALQCLSVLFGKKLESKSLIEWDRDLYECMYSRFTNTLKEAIKENPNCHWINTLISIRASNKNTIEEKIQKSANSLKALSGFPLLQKLKDSLSLPVKDEPFQSAFQSGPLSSLELGVVWDSTLPFLEQWGAKRDLEFLYVSTLIDLSLKKGIQVNPHFLYRSCNAGEFGELEKAAEKIPLHEIKTAMEEKIRSLYEELASESPADLTAYSIYRSFKKAFHAFYTNSKEGLKDPAYAMLAEEAYLSHDVNALRDMTKKSDPFEEPLSSFFGFYELYDFPLPDAPPQPFFFKTLEEFWQLKSSSLFKEFTLRNGLTRDNTQGDSESETLELAHFARDLFIDLLRKEAQCLKEPFPDIMTSLDQLDEVANALSYKKFLRGVDFFLQKTYKGNAFLVSLKQINEKDISIQEKRTLSMQGLTDPSIQECNVSIEHIHRLIDYLHISVLRKESPVSLGGFFKDQHTACWNWILASSFKDSLEVNLTTIGQSAELLKTALQSFKNKIIEEMTRLDIPSIYLELLEASIQKGDVKGLERIWQEVAYRRYLHVIYRSNYLGALQQKARSLEGKSISDVMKETKAFVETMENKDFSKYLLLQLTKLPYTLQSGSVEEELRIQALTQDYFQEKNSKEPFYLYLTENQFTCNIWGEETFAWISHLYGRFIEEQVQKIESKEYEDRGAPFILEELNHLEPFQFSKLDQIATVIRNQEVVDLQKCCDLSWLWGVEKALRYSLLQEDSSVNTCLLRVFEEIPTLQAQKKLITNFIATSLERFIVPIMRIGGKRSMQAAYEFLKERMQKFSTEYEFLCFFMENFFTYSRQEILGALEVQETAKKDLEALEKWIEGEGSYSSLRFALERDGFLDKQGKVIQNVSFSYTVNNIRDTLRMVRDFLDLNLSKYSIDRSKVRFTSDVKDYGRFDAMLNTAGYEHFLASLPEGSRVKQKCQDLYRSEKSSWEEVFRNTNDLLRGSSEKGVYAALLEEKLKEITYCGQEEIEVNFVGPALNNKDSGFSRYLNQVKIKPIKGMSPQEYYQLYISWVERISDHLNVKVDALQKENDQYISYRAMLGAAKKSLQENIKIRNWPKVNEITDQIIYSEYQVELDKIKLKHRTLTNSKLRMLKQHNQEKNTPSERIQAAKEDLSKWAFSSEDTEKLRTILDGKQWLKSFSESLEKDWDWISTTPLKRIPQFEHPFSNLSIYENQILVERVYVSLGLFLKQEVNGLNMHPFYEQLIERAFYHPHHFLWSFLYQEIIYKKYQDSLQELQKKGVDVSKLYELDLEVNDLVTEGKIEKTIMFLKNNSSIQHCQDLLKILRCDDLIEFICSKLTF